MANETNTSTQDVVKHHLAAMLSADVDQLLMDYVDESIVFTPDGPVQGLADLRSLFTHFLGELPQGSLDKLELIREDYYDNAAYLLWSIPGLFPMGTDTLVVVDGKILTQSFAAYRQQ